MAMASNPILLFGLIMGIIGSIIVYLRRKTIKKTIITFVLCFLAFGTPLHHIIVGAYLGSFVNQWIYRRLSNNWGAFLVSLLGIVPLSVIWYVSIQPILTLVISGIDDPGGVIVLGTGTAAILVILMLVGCGVYVLSSIYASFRRRNKPKPDISPPVNI
jgi:sorbitol-specific phosphotransferase system component IIBC